MTNLMRPDHDVFTQRNNALYPDETCWPTSVVQALHIRDVKMPEGKYEQPEDNLTHFCMTDKNVQHSWQEHDPSIDGLAMTLQNVKCSTEIETYADSWMQADVWSYPVVFLIIVVHLSIMLFAYADTLMRVISSVTRGVIIRLCTVMAPVAPAVI